MGVGVEVIRVTGRCNAGFRSGETFIFNGSRLAPDSGEARDCPVFGSLMTGNLGRLKTHSSLYLSCPDPGTGAGGNVLFKVWGTGGEVRAATPPAGDGQATADAAEGPALTAEVSEVLGVCPVGLRTGEALDLAAGRPVCAPAIGACAPTVSQLRAGSRFFGHVSCPGCTVDPASENRVVFLIGQADKWELGRLISEYLRLRRDAGEPPAATALSAQAMAHQARGNFAAATEVMRRAVEALRGALSSERTDGLAR